MTNKEKFIEVFNQEPDDNYCPVVCRDIPNRRCPYDKSCCYAGRWWKMEYKENEDGNVN